MTIKTITLYDKTIKERYASLEDPHSKKSGIKSSLPLKPAVIKDKKTDVKGKGTEKRELMIQISKQALNQKPIGYSSKGTPVKVPNGATHYAAVVNPDNSVRQERSDPRKEEEKDPFDFARHLNDNIQDTIKVADLIEAEIDGFDIVKKGNNLIPKGAGSNTADKLGIKGTKYSIDNLEKYPNVGKFVDPKVAAKDALTDNQKWINPFIGVVQNITNKEPGTKVVADAIVDVTNETVSNAAAAVATAAVANHMLNPGNLTLNSSPKMPVYTTAVAGGMIVENVVDNAVKGITDKAKESLRTNCDD